MTARENLKHHLHQLLTSYYRQGKPLKELHGQLEQLTETGEYNEYEIQTQLQDLTEELGIQQNNTADFLEYLNLK